MKKLLLITSLLVCFTLTLFANQEYSHKQQSSSKKHSYNFGFRDNMKDCDSHFCAGQEVNVLLKNTLDLLIQAITPKQCSQNFFLKYLNKIETFITKQYQQSPDDRLLDDSSLNALSNWIEGVKQHATEHPICNLFDLLSFDTSILRNFPKLYFTLQHITQTDDTENDDTDTPPHSYSFDEPELI